MLFTSIAYSNYATIVKSKTTPVVIHPSLPPMAQPMTDADKHAIASAFTLFTVFLLIEFACFIWALVLASKCHTHNKLLHVLAAFFFPIIYIIYYYGFSDCKQH